MRSELIPAVQAHPVLTNLPGSNVLQQLVNGAQAWALAVALLGHVHRRRPVGRGLPQPQPPLRRTRADGGAGLGGRRAGRRRRPRAHQLLRAPRDDGEVMRRRRTITLAFLLSALLVTARSRRAAPPTAAPPPRNDRPLPSTRPARPRGLSRAPARSPGWCPRAARTARPPAASAPPGDPVHPEPRPRRQEGGRRRRLTRDQGGRAGGDRRLGRLGRRVGPQGDRQGDRRTTSPQLTSSWFSASYWRIAGIAALLTLPFLCAAAIHALVRSDLGLLTRAAFGYLPLSLLAVGIASQLTMLLLPAPTRCHRSSPRHRGTPTACSSRARASRRSPRASPPAARSSRFSPRSSRSPRRWRCGGAAGP